MPQDGPAIARSATAASPISPSRRSRSATPSLPRVASSSVSEPNAVASLGVAEVTSFLYDGVVMPLALSC